MSSAGGLSSHPRSPCRRFAEGIAWLWRLDLAGDEAPGTVAIGALEEERQIRAALSDGRLAGAVVLGHDSEPDVAVADFRDLGRMHGRFSVLTGGKPTISSSLGVHAASSDRVLRVAADADGDWGKLTASWVLTAIAGFLEQDMRLSLKRLPPLGVIRLDDFPGTAQIQVEGCARSDSAQRVRAKRMVRAARRGGSTLNMAVAARALSGGDQVPLDSVWPRTIAELRKGVQGGQMEAVCHGMLHLDPDELERGAVEFREFAALDREEADRRIEVAVEWQARTVGRPRCFVAPAWGYSEGSLEALSERGFPHWMRHRPGPLVEGEQVFETLEDGPPGLVGLDYRPIAALAHLGMPPIVVFHGRMLDVRHLTPRPRPWDLARLALKRDLTRMLNYGDLRWVGCGVMIDELRRHDRRPNAPTGQQVLFASQGSTTRRRDQSMMPSSSSK